MNARYERDLFDPAPFTDGEALRRNLSEQGRCRVDLTLTHNRVSMISVVLVCPGHYRIRLHEHFLYAPAAVHEALAGYLRSRRVGDWKTVADFARRIPVGPRRSESRGGRSLIARGRIYDLRQVADEVNHRYFAGRIRCRIGWGAHRRRSVRRRSATRSIRYGSWTSATRTIRIHPLLDNARVPLVFIEYIIYHEMLHAALAGDAGSGRRLDHGPEFRRMEGRFPDIGRMRKMAGELLHVLLSGR